MSVKVIESNNKIFEVVSSLRTVFEPKTCELLEIRDIIRNGVQGLVVEENEILAIEFTDNTRVDSLYDIENVLIYNIGTGLFSSLTANGLVFQKKEATIEEFDYHYKYSIISSQNIVETNEKTIAYFNDIIFENRLTSYKATSFWKAIKESAKRIVVIDRIKSEKPYGFSINLSIPKNSKMNLATIIKPFLDGLISALHEADFTNEEALSISKKIGISADLIMENCCDVLWKRKYYKGRAWNPADEYCTKVIVSVTTSNDNNSHLSGTIFVR